MLRFIANLIWAILGGIWLALGWVVLGLLLCITIVGIPFGLQCFKAAKLSLFPFGKTVVLDYGSHPIANTLWVVFFGWEMALCYLVFGLLNCITIIGIPNGLQAFKMMKLAFAPFGSTVVKKTVAKKS